MARQMPSTVIAVGNQKGGVGKTTNAVHLAAALGMRGFRCLVVDLDPAAGATKHLGVRPEDYAGTPELLTGAGTSMELAIDEGMPPGVSLIPARLELSAIDTQLSRFADRAALLRAPLHSARSHFDLMILDTSPSPAFTTTVAAYGAADYFLLSAFAHPLSLGGISEALRDLADVRESCNPSLELLGIVLCNVDRRATRLWAQMQETLSETLPGRLFETSIAQAVVLPVAAGRGLTVFQLQNWTSIPVAEQYLRLADELLHRLNGHLAHLGVADSDVRDVGNFE
jgi:chromosome partitioning protein